MIYRGGLVHYDFPIGILCLASYFPKPLGHVRNPLSFRFATVCHVLADVDIQRMLFQPSRELAQILVEGARSLEREGVRAIVGSCGFMALFQQELTEAVRIPVASSSLMQLPLIRTLHGPQARIGVLTASSEALLPAHFQAAGVNMAHYPVLGMESAETFASLILHQTVSDMDTDLLRDEVVGMAETFCRSHQLDALLLECTDLSAFADAVQTKLGIPVYDINSLTEYLAFCVHRPAYPRRSSL